MLMRNFKPANFCFNRLPSTPHENRFCRKINFRLIIFPLGVLTQELTTWEGED